MAKKAGAEQMPNEKKLVAVGEAGAVCILCCSTAKTEAPQTERDMKDEGEEE
jgi:hypothetical protein